MGFPQIKGTVLGVPIIWTIVFWGLYLYWGPLILGNYHLWALDCLVWRVGRVCLFVEYGSYSVIMSSYVNFRARAEHGSSIYSLHRKNAHLKVA